MLDAAVVSETAASRRVSEGLAGRIATGGNVREIDDAFLDRRSDLLKQRPDVVEGWLEAELCLADPKNGAEVVRMAKAQTTGFDKRTLWLPRFGAHPQSVGGTT